ncbi:MAG: MFS transporter [Arthrobacter sp.]
MSEKSTDSAPEEKLFTNKDYRWWLAGTTSDSLTVSVRDLALPLLAFALTGSAVLAGSLITISSAIFVTLVLVGGVLVDRTDRRSCMIWRASLGALTWGMVALLQAVGLLTFPALVLFVALGAIGRSLFGMADNAALRSIVSGGNFARAQSVNQGRDAALEIAGGPFGAVLYAFAPWLPFAFSAVALLVLLLSAQRIQADLFPHGEETEDPSPATGKARISRIGAGLKRVPKDISSGFRIVFSNPALRAAALASTALNGGLTLVIFTIQLDLVSREVDPLLIGWVNGATALALLGGAILGGMVVPKMRVPTLVLISLTTAMVGIVGLVFFHQYAFLFLWFTILGLATPATGAAISGYVFTVIPIHFQGRAGSTLTVLNMGLSALSPLAAGWLIHGGNLRLALYAGVALFGAALVLLFSSSAFRQVGKPSDWA